jgi:transcriptional regulator with XRE-family HTH domain
MASKSTDKALTEEITPQNCGQKLDLICQVAGISLTELAAMLGEKPATLSHIKRGRRKPTNKFMDRLRALSLIRPKGYKREEKWATALTVVAVATGLSSLARTRLLGSAAAVTGMLMGGVIGGLLSFGMLHAVVAICKTLGLDYKESQDEIEVTRNHDNKAYE